MAANVLASCQRMDSTTDAAERLAANIRALREARGLTQSQLARQSGLPRATWANLESGGANPTLAVMQKVAVALQVSFEELIAAPQAGARFYPKDSLPVIARGQATVRKLLPDRVPGTEIDRMLLPPGARIVGIPHTPGTREYLTVESGSITLTAGGRAWTLGAGDVLVFRGDQKHSYANAGRGPAVGYSVVMLRPVE
jgi:XRE family transcriptional regulator, regulator of sulfur utilization